MAEKGYAAITRDGLWHNNVAFVQILGLCPTLAVTTNLVNGLGMGIATTLVLMGSNAAVSATRHLVLPTVRIPVFVLIIASLVTSIDLLMNAWLTDLHRVLGIFIPLIVVNCTVIGRAEAFASKNSLPRALMDGLGMGLGFTLALTLLGGMRELVGGGTLFDQAHVMFGEGARALTLHLVDGYHSVLLAILPPGAFLGLGLLIAAKNAIDQRLSRRRSAPVPAPAAAAENA